jgi:hypothetical protein
MMKTSRTSGRRPAPEIKNKKIEMYKLVFDMMKHLTTLSSGSILILITMLEKVFRASPPTFYIRISFGGFCVSIIAAVVAMMLLSMNAADGAITDGERNVFAIAASIAAVSFSLGIIFVVFAALPSLG